MGTGGAREGRLAAWGLGLGVVTVAAVGALLVSATSAASPALAVIAAGSGLGSMAIGVTVLRAGSDPGPGAGREALAGAILGSLLLAYLVFAAASAMSDLRAAGLSPSTAGAQAALASAERACVDGQQDIGVGPQAAVLACTGCPEGPSSAPSGSAPLCSLLGGSRPGMADWSIAGLVLAAWAGLAAGAGWLVRRRRPGILAPAHASSRR